MDKAIKKVFEIGYKSENGKYTFYTKDGTLGGWWYKWKTEDENGEEIELENPCCFDHIQYQYPLLFDPLFWQALGKHQGWKEKYKHRIISELRPALRCIDCDKKPMVGDGMCYGNIRIKHEWLENWHSFIDHIANGGDIDEFFNNLLK